MHLSDLKHIYNLEILAKQVVEGFITGMHKSPFHGFSVEFAEHRLYNKGESTRHIDWKLFAKSEKLFVKRFEEETNLRCHIIIDNSSSMHYPLRTSFDSTKLNKIQFSAVAASVLSELLKRQRDAIGLSIYTDKLDFFTPAKGSERHRRMILNQLEKAMSPQSQQSTNTYRILHQIAEKIHRRSMIFLFTDMFQTDKEDDEMFETLRHLKYNKHEVTLFHTFDGGLERDFNFENSPKKFIDVETGEQINLYADNIREGYIKKIKKYFNSLKLKCMQYKIDYVPVNINEGFEQILTTYLIRRQQFL